MKDIKIFLTAINESSSDYYSFKHPAIICFSDIMNDNPHYNPHEIEWYKTKQEVLDYYDNEELVKEIEKMEIGTFKLFEDDDIWVLKIKNLK